MNPSSTKRLSKTSMPLFLDSKFPDGAYIEDEEFAKHPDVSYWVRQNEDGDNFVPFSNLHRVRRAVTEHCRSLGHKVEDWFRNATDESDWAANVFYNDKPFGVAWIVGNRVIIRAKFTLSLFNRLDRLTKKDMAWSERIGGWVLLGVDQTSSEFNDILSDYGIVPAPGLSGHMEGSGKWKEELRKHLEKGLEQGLSFPAIFESERTYKKHQQISVVALAYMRQALLADQVGLGKGGSFIGSWLTGLQHLTNYSAEDNNIEEARENLKEVVTPGPLVIITNKSLKMEIAQEVLKWKPDAYVEILEGIKPSPIDVEAEFIVLNGNILAKRLPDILEAAPAGMIIDEAHSVKNQSAQVTIAAQELSNYLWENDDNPHIILASGTPFLNRPIELWSLLCIMGVQHQFTDYALTKVSPVTKMRTRSGWRNIPTDPFRAFQIRWCDGHYEGVKDEKGKEGYKNWVTDGHSNAAELNKLLLEICMVRRRKSDVMHPLPKLDEKIFEISPPFDDPQMENYYFMENEFKKWAKEEARAEAEAGGYSVAQALRLVSRKLDNAEGGMRFAALRQEIARVKVGPIKEWISRFMDGDPEIIGNDESRKKLIVFAHHREIQSLLLEDPELQKYGMVHIVAGQSLESTQEHKRLFQKDPNARLMICYMGAREGHTLTAAKDILIAELPYVPSWIVQIAGRAWARISEDFEPHEAYLHYAIVRNSIDTIIFQKNRIKKAMFNAVIDGEGLEELKEMDAEKNPEGQGDVFLELVASGKRQITIAA